MAVGRQTSQPRATFSQLAHLLSVTEVNSQVVVEAILDMRFEGRDRGQFNAQPQYVVATMGLMVRGGLQCGCYVKVKPPKLGSTGDGILRSRLGSPVQIKEIPYVLSTMSNLLASAFELSPKFEPSSDYGFTGASPSIWKYICNAHSLMLPTMKGIGNQYRVPFKFVNQPRLLLLWP